MRLSKLEALALEKISDSRADGPIIKRQAAGATVDQRERSYNGFRAFLRVDPVGRHLDKALWKTEDMPTVHATHPDLTGQASFTLVLADGFISSLVGDAGSEPWPKDYARFTFT